MTSTPGPAVRCAGLAVAAEGLTALAMAVALVVRGLGGADQKVVNGFGTAGWFVIVGGAVLAAGLALWTGRRWGHGPAVFTQLLLLPVAWYLAVGSHRLAFGIPVAMVALGTLALLFSPAAVRWAAGQQPAGRQAARSDRADPDTR